MFSPYGFPQQGAVLHIAVKCVATTNVANLNACSTTLEGTTLQQGDLVLLKNQTVAVQNGVYTVGEVEAGTAPLTRHDSCDNVVRHAGHLRVCVLGDTDTYAQTAVPPITIGTTPLVFTKTLPTTEVSVG